MNGSHPNAVELRLAATVLLVRDGPFEVLMVRRNDRGPFASAIVFPGGVVEPADRSDAWRPYLDGAEGLDAEERALRIAAIRETFEETAILLATNAGGGAAPICDASERSFLELVREHGLRLQLDALVPFAHWITPTMMSKRFDTHFYLAAAPMDGQAVCDGAETVAVEWTSPQAALARAQAGERSILFPTRLNLGRLAESDDSASALEAARQRPSFAVLPQPQERSDGLAVVIPVEAGYAETEDFRPY